MAVFTASGGSLPNLANEISSQYAWLSSRALQSAPPFGLHNSQEITYMDIAVQFSLLLTRQVAFTGPFRQLIHALDIAVAKTDGEQIFSRATR